MLMDELICEMLCSFHSNSAAIQRLISAWHLDYWIFFSFDQWHFPKEIPVPMRDMEATTYLASAVLFELDRAITIVPTPFLLSAKN